LAKNWNSYFNENLEVFAEKFYTLLQDNNEILTEKTQKMVPYMTDQNWLVQYASLEGLEIILFQMDYRTKHRVNMQEAIVEVQLYYTELEAEFTLFFEELQQHCKEKLIELA
jgi:acyl carrier protein phosphodiesterase